MRRVCPDFAGSHSDLIGAGTRAAAEPPAAGTAANRTVFGSAAPAAVDGADADDAAAAARAVSPSTLDQGRKRGNIAGPWRQPPQPRRAWEAPRK